MSPKLQELRVSAAHLSEQLQSILDEIDEGCTLAYSILLSV